MINIGLIKIYFLNFYYFLEESKKFFDKFKENNLICELKYDGVRT